MARPPTAVQLPRSLSDRPLSNVDKSLNRALEIKEQIARVDSLHLQVKAEITRANEFLLRLKEEGTELSDQTNGTTNPRPSQQDDTAKPPNHQHKDKKGREGSREKDMVKPSKGSHQHEGPQYTARSANSVAGTAAKAKIHKDASCKCGCPHHPLSAMSAESEAQLKKLADQYHVPTSLNTHVDEREVRDLEKRVRGLEGRVRGFEGLPPDREIALLEVERLRRELEGLARRREGLFEGLSGHLAEHESGKKGGKTVNGNGKALGSRQGNAKAATANGKAAGNGKK